MLYSQRLVARSGGPQGRSRLLSALAVMLGCVSIVAFLTGCEVPTDRSSRLAVQMTEIPPLIIGDSMLLSAVVLAETDTVPNAEIRFESGDVTVLLVDPDGRLLANKVGQTEVTARAIAYAQAENATQLVQVRDVYELDSIAPILVRYGSSVELFGVGLTQTIAATLGGADALFKSYTPVDPERPAGFGTLELWVTPPAPIISQAVLLGFEGILISDTLVVTQRDIYEPNDSVPRALGTMSSDGIFNPALAFERVRRGEQQLAVDWYTFTTSQPGDWTVSAWSPAGGSRFDVYVTNSLFWSSAVLTTEGAGVYAVAPGDWGTGAGFRPCGGLGYKYGDGGEHAFTFEVPPDSAVFALRDLPAGTYHVLVNYGEGGPFYDPATKLSAVATFVDSLNLVTPLPTGLEIRPGYNSIIGPDQFEENDYCSVAPQISVPDTLRQLTIDTPHDADWFSFTMSTSETVRFSVEVTENFADLDTYVIRDWRPDSLVVVDVGLGADGDVASVTAGAVLDPGDYFLVVVDFLGVPTEYTLSSEIDNSLPVPAAAQSVGSLLTDRKRILEVQRRRSDGASNEQG
jgi:hypothetical protein